MNLELETLAQRRINLLGDMRVVVREEVVMMHAEILQSMRLAIRDELQIFNGIVEKDMMDKLDMIIGSDNK